MAGAFCLAVTACGGSTSSLDEAGSDTISGGTVVLGAGSQQAGSAESTAPSVPSTGAGGATTLPSSTSDRSSASPPATTSTAATPKSASGSGGADPSSVLPAVDVVDVATGETVTLASLVDPDKPTLFWAWAPH